ncbi:MAG: YkvA family protein [Pseudomonadota bacterium]
MTKTLEGEILARDEKTPFDEEKAARDEARVRAGFWKTVRKALRVIPFSNEVVAAYFCAFDSKTPRAVRATLLGALAYFVLPLDSIPDFIFGIGFSDDITVLTAVLATLGAHITDEHRAKAREALNEKLDDL